MSGSDFPAMSTEAPRRTARPRQQQSGRGGRIRGRIHVAMVVFALAYLAIIGRLMLFGVMDTSDTHSGVGASDAMATSRPDIVDRNHDILATDIKMSSLYAEPRNILDPDEAAELITGVLPDLNASALRKKLSGNAGFVWVKREITPIQQEQIHALGIPGIGFLSENKRFYPGGPTASHILGLVNVDNQGIAGMEKYVDDHWLRDLHAAGFARGEDLEPVMLSIDLRVQHVLRDELVKAVDRYHAVAAAGVVLNVHTGEVLGMVSLPDYDPNDPVDALKPDRINRMTAGVFELGSVFKSFTLATGLDTGTVTLKSKVDATHALHYGRFTIHDFHATHRVLTVPEVFTHSSNIGAARIALKFGGDVQQEYFRRFGLLSKMKTELPEIGTPIVPSKWSDITTITAAFGHGIAVTPLQVAAGDAALMNGGKLIPPTFLPRTREQADAIAKQVVKPSTSLDLRYLFRLNVEVGSGRQAAVPGYMVGGKTGTAEKVIDGRYDSHRRLNSFLAAFPMDDPQYAVLVVIDDPKPEKPGMYATAGMNAAPTVGAVIRRSAALLGVKPIENEGGAAAILASN